MRTAIVLLAVCCRLSAAIAVPPGLDDGEFLIDTSGVHAENRPAVAFDGANFLVVWDDPRSGSDRDVYGARVTPSGTVLDPSGFVISQAANTQYGPALGFDGANFLVAWEDYRSGSDYDIYGARVTPSGTVLDPSGFVVSQAAGSQCGTALGFDGANFLVVWQDFRSGSDSSDICGARVTPSGTVLDASGFVISQPAGSQYGPALAFDGANFLVVWNDPRSVSYYDIYGARVTPSGTVLDASGFVVSQAAGSQCGPAPGFDGANFLVVWNDFRSGSDGADIYGARVTPAGVVFDEGPVVRPDGIQRVLALCRGSGSQMFLVYLGWAGTVGGKTYDTDRIWGKMNPSPGIEETMNDERATMNSLPTIVRRVLHLPASSVRRGASSALLNAAGRKVMDLRAGVNDVSGLAPGVYFVRGPKTDDGRPDPAVRKVVIAR